MTRAQVIHEDLHDYAQRLKATGLRTFVNRRSLYSPYLVIADPRNVVTIDTCSTQGSIEYRFVAKHVPDLYTNGQLVVNSVEPPRRTEFLTLEMAYRALSIFDTGDAARLYGFKGKRLASSDVYINAQGTLFREL